MKNKEAYDEVVGKLIYDDAWFSVNYFTYVNKPVYFVFEAFEDEKLTDGQRVNYLYATKNLKQLLKNALLAIKKISNSDFVKRVYVTQVYFTRNDEFGFLMEIENADELDLAVKFNTNGEIIGIGEQDILI